MLVAATSFHYFEDSDDNSVDKKRCSPIWWDVTVVVLYAQRLQECFNVLLNTSSTTKNRAKGWKLPSILNCLLWGVVNDLRTGKTAQDEPKYFIVYDRWCHVKPLDALYFSVIMRIIAFIRESRDMFTPSSRVLDPYRSWLSVCPCREQGLWKSMWLRKWVWRSFGEHAKRQKMLLFASEKRCFLKNRDFPLQRSSFLKMAMKWALRTEKAKRVNHGFTYVSKSLVVGWKKTFLRKPNIVESLVSTKGIL